MKPTDEDLVTAYVEGGDDVAFRRLMERHQARVYGYLMGMVGPSAADDLFQETFIRVCRALRRDRGSYIRRGKFIAWVLRIARNAALDHLRARKKWRDVPQNEETDYWDSLPCDFSPVDEQLEMKQQEEILDACIARLPPEQREVVLLRHESELTFREIAELTNCSINTAIGRMRYGLLNLRSLIHDQLHEYQKETPSSACVR
ncbi:MAG: RNA polymerase subunit sigma-24 [Bacteroidetes bacterium CG12_big_fil_rev_8_21_14_0_65_60_17]|nr:MAG: RNA polymerase subunit sigma-24 [Bacteroidetes bacterium CG12_big_fil_rev_8_21_14_0_65_60_17]